MGSKPSTTNLHETSGTQEGGDEVSSHTTSSAVMSDSVPTEAPQPAVPTLDASESDPPAPAPKSAPDTEPAADIPETVTTSKPSPPSRRASAVSGLAREKDAEEEKEKEEEVVVEEDPSPVVLAAGASAHPDAGAGAGADTHTNTASTPIANTPELTPAHEPPAVPGTAFESARTSASASAASSPRFTSNPEPAGPATSIALDAPSDMTSAPASDPPIAVTDSPSSGPAAAPAAVEESASGEAPASAVSLVLPPVIAEDDAEDTSSPPESDAPLPAPSVPATPPRRPQGPATPRRPSPPAAPASSPHRPWSAMLATPSPRTRRQVTHTPRAKGRSPAVPSPRPPLPSSSRSREASLTHGEPWSHEDDADALSTAASDDAPFDAEAHVSSTYLRRSLPSASPGPAAYGFASPNAPPSTNPHQSPRTARLRSPPATSVRPSTASSPLTARMLRTPTSANQAHSPSPRLATATPRRRAHHAQSPSPASTTILNPAWDSGAPALYPRDYLGPTPVSHQRAASSAAAMTYAPAYALPATAPRQPRRPASSPRRRPTTARVHDPEADAAAIRALLANTERGAGDGRPRTAAPRPSISSRRSGGGASTPWSDGGLVSDLTSGGLKAAVATRAVEAAEAFLRTAKEVARRELVRSRLDKARPLKEAREARDREEAMRVALALAEERAALKVHRAQLVAESQEARRIEARREKRALAEALKRRAREEAEHDEALRTIKENAAELARRHAERRVHEAAAAARAASPKRRREKQDHAFSPHQQHRMHARVDSAISELFEDDERADERPHPSHHRSDAPNELDDDDDDHRHDDGPSNGDHAAPYAHVSFANGAVTVEDGDSDPTPDLVDEEPVAPLPESPARRRTLSKSTSLPHTLVDFDPFAPAVEPFTASDANTVVMHIDGQPAQSHQPQPFVPLSYPLRPDRERRRAPSVLTWDEPRLLTTRHDDDRLDPTPRIGVSDMHVHANWLEEVEASAEPLNDTPLEMWPSTNADIAHSTSSDGFPSDAYTTWPGAGAELAPTSVSTPHVAGVGSDASSMTATATLPPAVQQAIFETVSRALATRRSSSSSPSRHSHTPQVATPDPLATVEQQQQEQPEQVYQQPAFLASHTVPLEHHLHGSRPHSPQVGSLSLMVAPASPLLVPAALGRSSSRGGSRPRTPLSGTSLSPARSRPASALGRGYTRGHTRTRSHTPVSLGGGGGGGGVGLGLGGLNAASRFDALVLAPPGTSRPSSALRNRAYSHGTGATTPNSSGGSGTPSSCAPDLTPIAFEEAVNVPVLVSSAFADVDEGATAGESALPSSIGTGVKLPSTVARKKSLGQRVLSGPRRGSTSRSGTPSAPPTPSRGGATPNRTPRLPRKQSLPMTRSRASSVTQAANTAVNGEETSASVYTFVARQHSSSSAASATSPTSARIDELVHETQFSSELEYAAPSSLESPVVAESTFTPTVEVLPLPLLPTQVEVEDEPANERQSPLDLLLDHKHEEMPEAVQEESTTATAGDSLAQSAEETPITHGSDAQEQAASADPSESASFAPAPQTSAVLEGESSFAQSSDETAVILAAHEHVSFDAPPPTTVEDSASEWPADQPSTHPPSNVIESRPEKSMYTEPAPVLEQMDDLGAPDAAADAKSIPVDDAAEIVAAVTNEPDDAYADEQFAPESEQEPPSEPTLDQAATVYGEAFADAASPPSFDPHPATPLAATDEEPTHDAPTTEVDVEPTAPSTHSELLPVTHDAPSVELTSPAEDVLASEVAPPAESAEPQADATPTYSVDTASSDHFEPAPDAATSEPQQPAEPVALPTAAAASEATAAAAAEEDEYADETYDTVESSTTASTSALPPHATNSEPALEPIAVAHAAFAEHQPLQPLADETHVETGDATHEVE